MTYDVKEIKARIKTEFERRNLSSYSVLPTIGLSKNTLDKHNVSMPKADTLAKIADLLGCSVDYLLGRNVDGLNDDEQQARKKEDA